MLVRQNKIRDDSVMLIPQSREKHLWSFPMPDRSRSQSEIPLPARRDQNDMCEIEKCSC
jgi:hypothetical protein